MSTEALTPGSEEYNRHLVAEMAHYGRIFGEEEKDARETLTQTVPDSWKEVEKHASARIRQRTGRDLRDHMLARLNARPGVRMLSLGSGPGGVELDFARNAVQSEMVLMDCNAELLAMGRERAASEGLNVAFETADLNSVDLPAGEFDLVFCHASLHHLIALDRIAGQIRKTLRPGGELVTVDVISRTGYRLWPESRKVLDSIWQVIPERFKLNHTAYGERRLDRELWEADTSDSGMECVQSEEILPSLERHLRPVHFVGYFSICRRLLDTMYGPNYDLSRSLDSAILNWIWEMDVHYLDSGVLRPETFFGIYAAPSS